jgi:hypothetical protein
VHHCVHQPISDQRLHLAGDGAAPAHTHARAQALFLYSHTHTHTRPSKQRQNERGGRGGGAAHPIEARLVEGVSQQVAQQRAVAAHVGKKREEIRVGPVRDARQHALAHLVHDGCPGHALFGRTLLSQQPVTGGRGGLWRAWGGSGGGGEQTLDSPAAWPSALAAACAVP